MPAIDPAVREGKLAPVTFQHDLAQLLKARFPFIYVPTWEEERALWAIAEVCADAAAVRTPRALFTWATTTGMVRNGRPEGTGTGDPGKALDFIAQHDEPAVFILKDFHPFFGGDGRAPAFQLIRQLRDLLVQLKHGPHPMSVVFLSPRLVLPDDLKADMTILEFPLPNFAEVLAVLRGMIHANRAKGRVAIALSPEDEELLAKAALGLTAQEAENAFARAIVDDGRLSVNDLSLVLEQKRQIIKKSGLLEVVETDLRLDDVGGLDQLKRWLLKRQNAWGEAAQRYNLPAPRGVLLTGVPGCGKSLAAKAASASWGVPLLRLDVGKVFSGLVGSSEENMRAAIQMAEAIAPVVLWIDEIEKGLGMGRGERDGGTSLRVFGTLLTWLQEKTRPVFVIATANDIAALPPEFMRKGRFDEIFFVDLPTGEERQAIFRLHLVRRMTDPELTAGCPITDGLIHELARRTEGFSGAEIEQVVVAGLFEAFAEARPIAPADFARAIVQTVPLAATQAETIQALRQWAARRAVPASLASRSPDVVAAAPLGGRALDA